MDIKNILNIGIIGSGRIASRFVDTKVEGVCVTAVYNPHLLSAERFAKVHGIGSFDDDLDSFFGICDAVYIATPHETHSAYIRKALEAGKNVLCEKPMTLSGDEAKDLFALADSKGLVLMEAVKTAYCMGFLGLNKLIESGAIGRVSEVEAAFTRLTPSNLREYWNREIAGSFTELGTYPLLAIFRILGTDFNEVRFDHTDGPNGVDTFTKAYFNFSGENPDGASRFRRTEKSSARAKTGLAIKSDGSLTVSGSKGYAFVPAPWWLTKRVEIHHEDPNQIEQYDFEYSGTGMQYETWFFRDACMKSEEAAGIIRSYRDVSIATASVMERFLSDRKLSPVKIKKEDVRIWGHRGCCYRYPENTLPAFEACARIPGITGCEMDVQLTKDGEVVVFHDENVKRVTDGGDRLLNSFTLSELKQLKIDNRRKYDYSIPPVNENHGNQVYIDEAFADIDSRYSDKEYLTIPTFDEFLSLMEPFCKNNGFLINVELKTSVIRYEGIEQKTLDLVRKHGLEKYVVYSSFLADSIELMKRLDPTCKIGMLASSIDDCLYRNDGTPIEADALHPWVGGLTTSLPEDKQNLPIRAWNGEEPFFTNDSRNVLSYDQRIYGESGVTDLITNIPERYLR
ncbi:MAG: glycerophosphodiester phosphodiesterase family protein [Candidatus Weimeria sp.]